MFTDKRDFYMKFMPPPAPLCAKECYENIGTDCIENIGADRFESHCSHLYWYRLKVCLNFYMNKS